jgi:hypothetical protein
MPGARPIRDPTTDRSVFVLSDFGNPFAQQPCPPVGEHHWDNSCCTASMNRTLRRDGILPERVPAEIVRMDYEQQKVNKIRAISSGKWIPPLRI